MSVTDRSVLNSLYSLSFLTHSFSLTLTLTLTTSISQVPLRFGRNGSQPCLRISEPSVRWHQSFFSPPTIQAAELGYFRHLYHGTKGSASRGDFPVLFHRTELPHQVHGSIRHLHKSASFSPPHGGDSQVSHNLYDHLVLVLVKPLKKSVV